MKVHSCSQFTDANKGSDFLGLWNAKVIAKSQLKVRSLVVDSLLGKTQVWQVGTHSPTPATPIVVFPGFRTSALFWILEDMIEPLCGDRQVFLVETNGQPNLSEGNTPSIKGKGYGEWAVDLLRKLKLEKVIVMGASFGGLVCLKLGIESPGMVKAAFIMNPGCLAPFSLAPSNLYSNLLPIISPKAANVTKFLNRSVFHAPTHQLGKTAMDLLVEYEVFVLKNWKDKAQKPYPMKDDELKAVNTKVHLLLGDKDPLFPHEKSMVRAKLLPKLDHVHVIPGVAHGIELSHAAMGIVAEVLGIGG
jgi:pimeloyl-ACP methyl ester carboxylesterase